MGFARHFFAPFYLLRRGGLPGGSKPPRNHPFWGKIAFFLPSGHGGQFCRGIYNGGTRILASLGPTWGFWGSKWPLFGSKIRGFPKLPGYLIPPHFWAKMVNFRARTPSGGGFWAIFGPLGGFFPSKFLAPPKNWIGLLRRVLPGDKIRFDQLTTTRVQLPSASIRTHHEIPPPKGVNLSWKRVDAII